jgi:hypothetical protein
MIALAVGTFVFACVSGGVLGGMHMRARLPDKRLTKNVALAITLMSALAVTSAVAQEDDQAAELAKKLQNPVAALISMPFQSNFEWGGGRDSDGYKYTLNFQPVIPISLGERWNLISRTIVPVIHQDEVFLDETQNGMGDILQSLFFSPKEPGAGGIIWGVGPALLLPTATTRFLGAEKFSLGPTVVALRQHSGWTYGVLANHLWSVAGTSHTGNVNATFLQPFLTYTFKTHTTLGINTESTYDWATTKWTVPINPFVSQILKIGPQPISLQLGPKLYVEGPTEAPDWGLRLAFILLFPR